MLEKSNLDKSIDSKEVHPSKILFMSSTEDVSKLDKSIDFKEMHP